MRILFLAVTSLVFAAEVKGPLISADQRAAYWRARAEVVAAQSALNDATVKVTTAVQAMQAVCGEKHPLILGKDGEPECAAIEEKK